MRGFIGIGLSLVIVSAGAAPEPPPIPRETFVYTDKPALVLPPLVSASAARAVNERFQAGYARLGRPRLAFRINLDARTLSSIPDAPANHMPPVPVEGVGAARDLEAILSKLFQQAGARVLGREAGPEPAEVIIEVLAATRRLVVREVSGDRVHLVADLQMAAVRPANGRLLAQAGTHDLFSADA